MKKRFKLITTIASLCLAVALMAFGVYAATIPNFVVTGNVNFGATEIDGAWSYLKVSLENGTFESGEDTVEYDAEDIAADDFTGNQLGAITLTSVDAACEITIEVKFTNTSNAKDASITAVTTQVANGAGYNFVESSNEAGSSAKNEGAETACTVVLTLTVSDKAQSVNNIPFTVTFSANPV